MKREIILSMGGREVTVTAVREGQSIVVERGEERYTVEVVGEKVIGEPAAGGATTAAPAARPAPSGGPGAVPSPMTGVVDKVLVQEGARVTAGDQIVVLEAMKMYIDVTAPVSGTVSRVAVSPGDSVKEGHPLMTIE